MRCLLLLLWLPAQSKIQAPPSVLFEDLQEAQCFTSLLQSSKSHVPKAEAQALWKSLKGEPTVGRAQMQQVREVLAKHQDSKLHDLLQEHFQSFALCDTQLQSSMALVTSVNSTASKWRELHASCAIQEAQRRAEVVKCNSSCEEQQKRLHETWAHCSFLDRSYRGTRCRSQAHMARACDTYESCRQGMSVGLRQAQKAVRSQSSTHALLALRCLLENASADCDAFAAQLLSSPPRAMLCHVPQEDCDEVSKSVLQEDLKSDLTELVSGVSFIQEGIEEASVLPQMQQAFAGPLATPVCLLLALFTMLMLMARCANFHRPELTQTINPKSVDQWCVNSEKIEEACLCGELMVPRKSHCSIFLPSRGGVCTDKMGQTMFRTSSVVEKDCLQISLSYQDGRVFASCHVKEKRAQLYQGDAPYGSIAWELPVRSWFHETPGCFVVRGAVGQLLFKALPNLRFVDAQQRQLAAAQRVDGQWELEVQGADLGLVTLALLAIDYMDDLL